MSVLLQETGPVQEDHGGAPASKKIEKAIRAGKAGNLPLRCSSIDKDYFKKAPTKVAQNALIPMRGSQCVRTGWMLT